MAVEAPGTIAAFLASYLANGYYRGEGNARYPDPALVDQAEAIGKALAAGGVTPSAFNRLIRTLKDSKKLPAEAQQGALREVIVQVTELENHKKAPPLLREVVERNRAAVQTGADFAACLKHFQHIGIFLEATKAS